MTIAISISFAEDRQVEGRDATPERGRGKYFFFIIDELNRAFYKVVYVLLHAVAQKFKMEHS